MRSTLAIVVMSCFATVNAVLHSYSKNSGEMLSLNKSNDKNDLGQVLGILFLIFVALMLWYEYTQPYLIAENNIFGVNAAAGQDEEEDREEDDDQHAVLMTQE